MPADDPRTLLHDAVDGPVASLNHDRLRRRARRRTGTRWTTAAVAGLATVAGVATLLVDVAGQQTVDIADTPPAAVAPEGPPFGPAAVPATLDLPPAGEVAAAHAGLRPVFVAHRDNGEVLVLDAISPDRATTELPKVLAFCRDPWIFETEDGSTAVETPGVFRDLWHGSLFALDGSWLGGPAPTGLPRLHVQSVDDDTVTIGLPWPAPEREAGPFEDVLGPRADVDGRPVADGTDCATTYDQTRDTAPPDDQTAVLWHRPQHPDRWLYPFEVADEQGQQEAPTDTVSLATIATALALTSAIAGVIVYLRRREA